MGFSYLLFIVHYLLFDIGYYWLFVVVYLLFNIKSGQTPTNLPSGRIYQFFNIYSYKCLFRELENFCLVN
ncbi:hypothetical protein AM228_08560 [Planktothricoides sp. SR001]|nr:hypothetical protein AM228_08560 [Planktothricoides sp. SR001]